MRGIQTLKKDLQRGVTLVRDKNYESNCNGITRFSLEFFDTLVKKGVISEEKVYRADLTYHRRHHYSLTLYTIDGYSFEFNGCSFGYHGEGSRGSEYILRKCGFKNSKRVFEKREHIGVHKDTIRLFKRIK